MSFSGESLFRRDSAPERASGVISENLMVRYSRRKPSGSGNRHTGSCSRKMDCIVKSPITPETTIPFCGRTLPVGLPSQPSASVRRRFTRAGDGSDISPGISLPSVSAIPRVLMKSVSTKVYLHVATVSPDPGSTSCIP